MKYSLFIIAVFIFATNSFSQNIPGYVPRNGLRAWYPFNGNANDESGNGYNGTPLAEASLATDRFGNANAAYSFNGNNDSRIITALTGDFGTSDRTISFWFNPS